jgi:uncharacterized protein
MNPNIDHYYYWRDNNLYLEVHIQTNAKNDKFLSIYNNRLKVAIKAPPVDGKANSNLKKFLAKSFAVKQKQVSIIKGLHISNKLVCIENPAARIDDLIIGSLKKT